MSTNKSLPDNWLYLHCNIFTSMFLTTTQICKHTYVQANTLSEFVQFKHTGSCKLKTVSHVGGGYYFPIRWTTHSCWQSGQRLFCLTHSDIQQLWKEWLHSPQTTANTNTYFHNIVLWAFDVSAVGLASEIPGLKKPSCKNLQSYLRTSFGDPPELKANRGKQGK